MGILKTVSLIALSALGAGWLGLVKLPSFLNISAFGSKASFSIDRVHNLSFASGMSNKLSMLLDFRVENNSNVTVTAKNLLIHVYTDRNEWIGSSVVYPYPITFLPNSITIIPSVQVYADASKLALEIAGPQLINYLKNGGGQEFMSTQKLGRSLVIQLSVELDGFSVNQTLNYEF